MKFRHHLVRGICDRRSRIVLIASAVTGFFDLQQTAMAHVTPACHPTG